MCNVLIKCIIALRAGVCNGGRKTILFMVLTTVLQCDRLGVMTHRMT